MNTNYYQELLDSIDFAVAEHELVYDEKGNPIDYKYLYVNKAFCVSIGKTENELIGKTVYELFPGTEFYWVERYANVVLTGVSSRFINYSSVFDQYFSVFSYKSKDNCFVTSFKDITDYVKVSAPEVKNDIISNLFSEGKTAYFEFDLKNKVFDYSNVLHEIIGMDIVTYDDFANLFHKFTHPADQKRVVKGIASMFDGDRNEIAFQLRFFNQTKEEYVWISYFAYIEKRSKGVPVLIKGLVKDIDEGKRKSLESEHMSRLFRETRKIADIATFYFTFENNEFKHSSELDEFFGFPNLVYLEQVRKLIHPDDLDKYDFTTNEIKNHPEGLVSDYRIIKDNEIRYIRSSVFGETDETGEIYGVFGILKDTTEIERSREEIKYFANHDVLTGLYNRNNFETQNKELEGVYNTCLLICDVDGLKLVNDAFGHIEGDQLLTHLADILKDAAGVNDVYRIGGDEFVITIKGAEDNTPIEMEEFIKNEIKKFRMYGVGFDVSIGYGFIDENTNFEEAFRNAENLMYRRKLTERKSRKSTALSTIMQTMHEKTEETEDHCHRVGQLASRLLKSVGKKRDYEIEEIKLIADMHDIGKISISDKILSKPNRLNDEEYDKIKYHSESGYKIISNIIDNEDIAIAVLYHHERYDGRGYPHGLSGEDIPLYSRIIAICDAYDAMTSNRVYRDALSKKQALKEIKNNSGIQFDPILVEKFLKIVK